MRNIRPQHVDKDSSECSVVISTLTASDPIKPFLLPVRIQEDPLSHHTPFSYQESAFVDSGAMGNFIHPRLVTQLNIQTQPRPNKLRLHTVTGKTFFTVEQQVKIALITKHGHEEVITLDVAPVGKHNLILGLPWCMFHEVQFDWNEQDITQWSPACEGRCFPSHIVAPLHVQLLSPDAQIPVRATEGAIGYDLSSTIDCTIPPASRQIIPTGVAIQLPENTYGRIAPHSGLAAKHSIDIAAGVIDPDYRGELKVVMVNNGQQPYMVKTGHRIAQLILENATLEDVVVKQELLQTERQESGFGSTDVYAIEPPPEMEEDLVDIYAISLGHSASTSLRPQEERYKTLRSQIPSEYHDYLDVFDEDLAMSKCPPCRPGYDFEIHLTENAKLPPPARPYQLSRQEREILKEWLDGMEQTGMITRCNNRTPTAAPVFFVGKKDGSKRPVIDYRRLNDVTIRDSYPLPRIDQIMDQVRGSKIFSKFDMKSGYNQLRIKEGQEWLTTFNTPEGPYQMNVMTFGFMNAPPAFQRFVDDHIYKKPELVNHLVGYLDDGNVHNSSLEEHITTVRNFLHRCREAGVTLNPKKCEFHKDKIDFLGVELSDQGFEMERVKVDAIREWKPPRNVRAVREFTGFCNFYRRFVKNFAEIARPLHDLTRQDQKWEWGPRQQHAFQTLKDVVCAAPVLIHADPDERFRVETDASNYAYGAILSQKGKQDQKQHPVAFFSKSMTPAERNYGISDKEGLAIIKALQHWRHWLEGTKIPIEILTDHKNLQYFTKPRVLNRRQLRWMDLLNHYNYVISY